MRFALAAFAVFIGLLCLGIVLLPSAKSGTANASEASARSQDATPQPPTADQEAEEFHAEVQRTIDAARAATRAAQEESASRALNAVRYSLRDPNSAEFQNTWVVRVVYRGVLSTLVCGEVNAKNGFGGYVGYTPFLAVGSTVMTPSDHIFEEVYAETCAAGERLFQLY